MKHFYNEAWNRQKTLFLVRAMHKWR